ncbi:MAG: methyltransferase domain-containing protein [Desulfobacteraceae bacterium]|jgi:ubiquinone/menaquinone biosynthesis C-methylase UbiE
MSHHPTGAGKSSYDLIDADMFFNAIDLEPGMTVLDLACGAGKYTLAMARKMESSGRIIAVDLWQEGIAALRQSAEAVQAVSIEPHVADIRQKLPLPDASVDICLMATVLHDIVHEGDPLPVLRQVARVLKPKGVLAVAEFKKEDAEPGPPKAIRMRLEEVSALLLKVGFLRFSGVVELGPQIYFAQFKRL